MLEGKKEKKEKLTYSIASFWQIRLLLSAPFRYDCESYEGKQLITSIMQDLQSCAKPHTVPNNTCSTT